ncbi:MAG: serine/threonine protein kinase, partial [Polyangiaceae bacterium]
IVHRDLKPDNIFYAKMSHGDQAEEIVKVLDFGIAKMLGEGQQPLNAVETQAGTVFGTPRYMSPEQAQAKPLDARSDLYSVGVLLYHMLTGRPPFTDDDAIIVMARHIKNAPRAMTDVAPDAFIPPEIEAVVQRALAKDPDKRPSTAEAMSHELMTALEGGGAISSGVRASLSGPPRSSRRGSSRPPPPIIPHIEHSDLSGPLPPDVNDPSESVPIGIIPTGAFAPSKNAPLKIIGVLALIGMAVAALVFFATRPKEPSPRSAASASQPIASSAETTAATTTAADPVVPTVDISSLPRISSQTSSQTPGQNGHEGTHSQTPSGGSGTGHGGHHSPHGSSSATAPAPSSTNRYGILD